MIDKIKNSNENEMEWIKVFKLLLSKNTSNHVKGILFGELRIPAVVSIMSLWQKALKEMPKTAY